MTTADKTSTPQQQGQLRPELLDALRALRDELAAILTAYDLERYGR